MYLKSKNQKNTFLHFIFILHWQSFLKKVNKLIFQEWVDNEKGKNGIRQD